MDPFGLDTCFPHSLFFVSTFLYLYLFGKAFARVYCDKCTALYYVVVVVGGEIGHLMSK